MLEQAQGSPVETQTRSIRTHIQSVSIWIADTALNHAYTIDGFDTSLEQCPVAELLPAGCSIRRLDILQDLPASLTEKYDVVHVRLLLGGLGDNPVPALRNLIAMLSMGFPDDLRDRRFLKLTQIW